MNLQIGPKKLYLSYKSLKKKTNPDTELEATLC